MDIVLFWLNAIMANKVLSLPLFQIFNSMEHVSGVEDRPYNIAFI